MDLTFTLTPRQTIAYKILASEDNADLLYGGAKGGGKSYFLCVWAYLWACDLIRRFGIKASENPLPVGFLGRKRSIDFERTTFETWKKVIPDQAYVIRKMAKEIVINNAVKILYGGLDDRDDVNKFNSAELAFIAIDQAEETEHEDISTLEGSLRLTYNGIIPPYKALYTANPRKCWLKQRYLNRGQSERSQSHFVRALPSDNKHLPYNYEDTLKGAFGHNPALLAAYLHGEWDVFEGMFFEEFDRRFHVYNPNNVVIQKSWPRFRSIDWGYASPMACYWHAVGPDKHVYTYREWYRTRILDVDAAREIKEITEKAGEEIDYTVGDPMSFPMEIAHWKMGKTIPMTRAEVWAEQGVPIMMGDNRRVAGWSIMRNYMRIKEYMGSKSSWWHISEACPNLIDEITTAVHDKNRVEDIDSDGADHGIDSCRLFLVSRPPLLDMTEVGTMSMLEAAERQEERNREKESSRMGA